MKFDFSKDEAMLRSLLKRGRGATVTCPTCKKVYRMLSEASQTLKYLQGKVTKACTPFCSFTCRNVWLVTHGVMPIARVDLSKVFYEGLNDIATAVFWQVHEQSRVAALRDVWKQLRDNCDESVPRVLAYGEFYWFWRIIRYKNVFYLATMVADEAALQDDKRRFVYAYQPIRNLNVWEVRDDAPVLV